MGRVTLKIPATPQSFVRNAALIPVAWGGAKALILKLWVSTPLPSLYLQKIFALWFLTAAKMQL